MDLVIGIELKGGEATALARGSNGANTRLSIADLDHLGLPTEGTVRSIHTDLGSWQRTDFREYAVAIERPVCDARHGAWTFTDGSRRYIIPALALLRALARPKKVLLPRLFHSQSLDDVCELDPTLPVPGVRLTRLIDKAPLRRNQCLAGRLSWFFCFPSARQAWASVLDCARAGRLDLQLPRASIEARIKYVSRGSTAYVTWMNILSLEAMEAPFDFAIGHQQTIDFIAEVNRSLKPIRPSPPLDIPRRDGEVALSDYEWEAVRPLLNPPGKRSAARVTVDGVLSKLSSADSWMNARYPEGISAHGAAVAYQRWRKDGRWEQILDTLRALRREST